MVKQGLVKFTKSGRLQIIVSETLKPVLASMVERSCVSTSFDVKIRAYLLSEIYYKYYTVLHLFRVNRLLLTQAQAAALWLAFNDQDDAFDTPELGNVMMQLHQKLS